MSNEPTIEQINDAIALFMGFERYEDKYGIWFKRDGLINCLHPKLQSLEYHSSFDWLMPVVEKIETMSNLFVKKAWISINGCTCAIWSYFDVQDVLRYNMPNDCFKVKVIDKTKLIATHKAVYQFIQWYNKQSTTTNAKEALSGEGEKEENKVPENKALPCGNCGGPGDNYIGNQYYLCDKCMESPEHL